MLRSGPADVPGPVLRPPCSRHLQHLSRYRRYTRACLYVDKGSAVAGGIKKGPTQPQNIEANPSGKAEKLKTGKLDDTANPGFMTEAY